MTVISLDVWQSMPGESAEVDALLVSTRQIDERFGARVSMWRPIEGDAPAEVVVYSTEFDGMAAYRAWADRTRADLEHSKLRSRLEQSSPTIAVHLNHVVVQDEPLGT